MLASGAVVHFAELRIAVVIPVIEGLVSSSSELRKDIRPPSGEERTRAAQIGHELLCGRAGAVAARIGEIGVDVVFGHPDGDGCQILAQFQFLIKIFHVIYKAWNGGENLGVADLKSWPPRVNPPVL